MLCERLGMTLQEAQQRISSSEFTLWKVYLQEEPSRFHRDDHNFAMIAAEVRRVLHKKPASVKNGDFLLRFESPRQRKERKLLAEEIHLQKVQVAAMFGIDPPPPLKEDEDEEKETDVHGN